MNVKITPYHLFCIIKQYGENIELFHPDIKKQNDYYFIANGIIYSDIELISFTKGSGRISLNYDGYDNCHNQDEIIELKNYNKDADEDFTSNSIFCSKGTSYSVKGSEVKEYMHCDLEEIINKWL